MKTLFFATLVAAILPLAAGAAKAADATEAAHASVAVGDLDLGRSAGATVALARIQQAARSVCGPVALPVELQKARWRRVCVQHATENAIRDLDAPLVTARYYHTDPARLLAAR